MPDRLPSHDIFIKITVKWWIISAENRLHERIEYYLLICDHHSDHHYIAKNCVKYV